MKKAMRLLAFVLCLVLMCANFASCGKKDVYVEEKFDKAEVMAMDWYKHLETATPGNEADFKLKYEIDKFVNKNDTVALETCCMVGVDVTELSAFYTEIGMSKENAATLTSMTLVPFVTKFRYTFKEYSKDNKVLTANVAVPMMESYKEQFKKLYQEQIDEYIKETYGADKVKEYNTKVTNLKDEERKEAAEAMAILLVKKYGDEKFISLIEESLGACKTTEIKNVTVEILQDEEGNYSVKEYVEPEIPDTPAEAEKPEENKEERDLGGNSGNRGNDPKED